MCEECLFSKNDIKKLVLPNEIWYNVKVETRHSLSYPSKVKSTLYKHEDSTVEVDVCCHCGTDDADESKKVSPTFLFAVVVKINTHQ